MSSKSAKKRLKNEKGAFSIMLLKQIENHRFSRFGVPKTIPKPFKNHCKNGARKSEAKNEKMVRKRTQKASENPEKTKKLRFADRCEKNEFPRYSSDRPPSSQTLTIIKTFLRKVTSATKPTEKRCESEVRK